MATVTQIGTCDGYTVEAPAGCLGWVEETWLDADGRPAAAAVRTPDGRRGLLLLDAVQAADPDAQELIVGGDTTLLELEAPRIAHDGGAVTATWRASAEPMAPEAAGAAHAAPIAPALTAARASTARHERPLWQTIVFALTCLVVFVGGETGLLYGITYLVSGRPY